MKHKTSGDKNLTVRGKKMGGISTFVGNWLAADQLIELRKLNESMANGEGGNFSTPEYDWQNPEFQGTMENIKKDFYARHPEIVRGSGDFNRKFPEKEKGIETLNRLSELNRIHPDEYLQIFKEILNF